MPLFGPPNIEQLKAKRDIAGLVKAVGYKKSIVGSMLSGRDSESFAAAKALGEIGDARAVEPLIALLGDENSSVQDSSVQDSTVQMNAAVALRLLRDARAVEPLIAAITDKGRVYNRGIFFIALGAIGGARADEVFTAALKDEDSSVREDAAHALEMLTRREGFGSG